MLNQNQKAIQLFLLLLFFLVGCQHVTYDTTDLSWAEGAIVFFSDRKVYSPNSLDGESSISFLFIMDQNGTNVSRLAGYYHGSKVSWSPTGEIMAVSANFEDTTCLMLISLSQRRCVVKKGRAPSWSPDGRWIAFDGPASSVPRKSGVKTHLSVFDLSTGEIKQLTPISLTQKIVEPTWSPDSKWLAISVDNEQGVDIIWKVDIEGNNLTALTEGYLPAWSPKVDEIAFVRDGDIWLLEVNNGQESLFIENASSPEWSPDGTQLLFISEREGNFDIFRINRDGTGIINLTNHPEDDYAPSWRPRLKDKES